MPEPPDWLEGSHEALKLWRQYAPTLNSLGLLETLDAVAFAMLCDCFGGYLRLRQELGNEQLVLLCGDTNYPTSNPLSAMIRSQTKALRELLADFGMTPTSRTSLTGSTSIVPRATEAVDPLAELLKQMNVQMVLPSPKKPTKKIAAKKSPKRQPAKQTRDMKSRKKSAK